MGYFVDSLLQELQTFVSEGQLVAKMALQVALDAAHAASKAMAVMMQCLLWLFSSGISKELQTTVEDLPFQCCSLFHGKTSDLMALPKDSRATLRAWGSPLQPSRNGISSLSCFTDRLPTANTDHLSMPGRDRKFKGESP
ncbi:hypothetical protein KIL84_015985 [Mauremys mutica]|uniref:Uncharacterized protein n=1 Tax=Mauremys mutica TaxID=74926 RepID=A0A9D4AQ63_9SAUR|nr:hypothetical protein KIL84_015985 [Mauremys mutica]